jgi:hypothetical protein
LQTIHPFSLNQTGEDEEKKELPESTDGARPDCEANVGNSEAKTTPIADTIRVLCPTGDILFVLDSKVDYGMSPFMCTALLNQVLSLSCRLLIQRIILPCGSGGKRLSNVVFRIAKNGLVMNILILLFLVGTTSAFVCFTFLLLDHRISYSVSMWTYTPICM